MVLSQNTIEILKNFAAINPNLLFKQGSTVDTVSDAKTMIGSANIAEVMPQEFGIYDLNEFLSILTLVDQPQLEFGKTSVTIRDGNTSIEYRYAALDTLTVPTRKVSMPAPEVVLNLTSDSMNRLKKAASVLGHSSIQLEGKNGRISANIVNPKDKSSNKYTIVVDEKNACTKVFSLIIPISHLKMMTGDYVVSFSSKLISHFKNTSIPVEYWIALEKESTFGS